MHTQVKNLPYPLLLLVFPRITRTNLPLFVTPSKINNQQSPQELPLFPCKPPTYRPVSTPKPHPAQGFTHGLANQEPLITPPGFA